MKKWRTPLLPGLWLLARLAILLSLCLPAISTTAFAAAPIRIERNVSDVTPWLEPYVPVEQGANDAPAAKGRWSSLEIVNPKKDVLHRIITIDAVGGGVLRFLAVGGKHQVTAVQAVGEGARIEMIALDGGTAAELHLTPLPRHASPSRSTGPGRLPCGSSGSPKPWPQASATKPL